MTDTTPLLDIVARVKAAGAMLYLDQGELKLKYKKGSHLPAVLLDEIKNNRAEIIELLPYRNDPLVTGQLASQNLLVPYNRSRPDDIPLSFSQKRLWFIDKLEGSTHYHIPVLREIIGDFNSGAFCRAWKTMVTKYEVFRTVFRQVRADVRQEILPPDRWSVNQIDAAAWSDDEIVSWVSEQITTPFDLSNDYLVRVYLLSLGEKRTGIVVLYHHVVVDAWSMPIVEQELISLYNAYSRSSQLDAYPPEVQYLDYAVWQNQYMKGELFEKKLNWWVAYLTGVKPINLPLDYPRPAVPGTKGANYGFTFSTPLCESLQAISRKETATLFMTCLAGFNILLHRYSGQEDICIGTPVANRVHKETETMIGFFVNTMAFRINFEGDPSFRSVLSQLKDRALIAYQLQDIPIEAIIERVVTKRERGAFKPLFHVMFMFQNSAAAVQSSEPVRKSESETRSHSFGPSVAKFDLTFMVSASPTGIAINIEYCVDLFKGETIERMGAHFEELMRCVVKSPDRPVSELLTQLDRRLVSSAAKPIDDVLPDQRKTATPLAPENFKSTGIRNEVEEKLVGIWRQVLGIELIGINSNFFELGGHSLKVMEVIYLIQEELSVKVPVKVMFEAVTVDELTVYIMNELSLLEKNY